LGEETFIEEEGTDEPILEGLELDEPVVEPPAATDHDGDQDATNVAPLEVLSAVEPRGLDRPQEGT